MCDFEGWATYYNVKCIDGSIIKTGSFEKCDKLKTDESCKYCNASRDDWTFDTEKYNFGDLGEYYLSLSIVSEDSSILVEFGKIGGQNVIAHKFKGIKFCPYCGKKLV